MRQRLWAMPSSHSCRRATVCAGIAGTATGFRGLEQGLGLDVVPYFIARAERTLLAGMASARDSATSDAAVI